MKKLVFFAFSLSLLLANTAAAQTLPKSVFDPAACGCATIDIDKILQKDSSHIKSIAINKELLLAQFKQQGNTAAMKIIEDLTKPNDKTSLEQKIKQTIGTISDKKDGRKEAWLNEFNAIAQKADNKNTDKISLYIACRFAEELHTYYVQYPEEAGDKAKEFYKKATPLPIENPNASALAGGKPEAKLATAAGDSTDSTPWLWIMISGGLALFSLFLLTNRPKQDNSAIDNLKRDLESSKAENQKLRTQVADKERESQELSSKNNALKKQVDYFEQQQQKQQQPININPNPQQNTVQNTVPSAIRRYLYAPSMDGVFANNSIKPQPDGETFYLVDMAQENSNRAPFSLILKPEVVNRAESMAQQYLLPACELKGTSRLPQDLSQIKMTAGELVREGQGWRVAKKIILSW